MSTTTTNASSPAQLDDYWTDRLASRARRMKSSCVRELLKVSERPDFISFAGGFPAPELFPIKEVAEVSQRILEHDGYRALQYSATEGYRPLRELIASRMRERGVPADVENVLITTGSQQGLDLIGKVLVDEDDRIMVESPTYLAMLQAWAVYGADFHSIQSDASGLIPEDVESQLANGLDPKMLYCVPTFQNPSGSTLSAERRQRLVEMTSKRGLAVVEDDPYRELRFEGEPLNRLIEIDAQLHAPRSNEGYDGNIVYMTTYSKTLAPALRVGVIVAAIPLIRKLVQAKQSSDLHTPTFNQMIVYELEKVGFIHGQAKRVAAVYHERRDVMLETLLRLFPSEVECRAPLGGMFLWIRLPLRYNTADLLQRALERKVAFVPGESFFADGSGHNTMRLNFSNCSPDLIREGIARLAELLN